VGDRKLTYHGISYGTQLGATYANLFPNNIRAMVFDGTMDFAGNATGHDGTGTTVPLNTSWTPARLFVTEGYGHSSMLSPSTCTEQVKRDS
jgi:alpha/beta hydrolase fold